MQALTFTRTLIAIALPAAELALLPDAPRAAELAYKQAHATAARLTSRRNKLAEAAQTELAEIAVEELTAARQASATYGRFVQADAVARRAQQVAGAAWEAVLPYYEVQYLGGDESYPYLALRPEPTAEVVVELPATLPAISTAVVSGDQVVYNDRVIGSIDCLTNGPRNTTWAIELASEFGDHEEVVAYKKDAVRQLVRVYREAIAA